jgi:hypothetical protein
MHKRAHAHALAGARRRSVADLPDFTQPASGLPSVATRKAMAVVKQPAVEPKLPPYRPLSNRLRGWIILLTLVTVLGLAALLLRPQWRLLAAKAARADAAALAACPPDATRAAPGCPGSRMPVLVLPVLPMPMPVLPMPVLLMPAAPAADAASR